MKNKFVKWLSLPYAFWSIAFIIIPLIMVFYFGLTDKTGKFTFANILSISLPVHFKSLLIALLLSFISTVICLLLSYPLAMILSSLNSKNNKLMILIFVLPIPNLYRRTIENYNEEIIEDNEEAETIDTDEE